MGARACRSPRCGRGGILRWRPGVRPHSRPGTRHPPVRKPARCEPDWCPSGDKPRAGRSCPKAEADVRQGKRVSARDRLVGLRQRGQRHGADGFLIRKRVMHPTVARHRSIPRTTRDLDRLQLLLRRYVWVRADPGGTAPVCCVPGWRAPAAGLRPPRSRASRERGTDRLLLVSPWQDRHSARSTPRAACALASAPAQPGTGDSPTMRISDQRPEWRKLFHR